MTTINLHIPRVILSKFIATIPTRYGPGCYDLQDRWHLDRSRDKDSGHQLVWLRRNQYAVDAICVDGDDLRQIETNIPLSKRLETRPPGGDPTLALMMLMVAIQDEFGGTLLDTEFRDMVKRAAGFVDHVRTAK